MSAVDELLNDSGISACLSTHQGSVTQVRRAAELLAEKGDAFIALNRLLQPLRRSEHRSTPDSSGRAH